MGLWCDRSKGRCEVYLSRWPTSNLNTCSSGKCGRMEFVIRADDKRGGKPSWCRSGGARPECGEHPALLMGRLISCRRKPDEKAGWRSRIDCRPANAVRMRVLL